MTKGPVHFQAYSSEKEGGDIKKASDAEPTKAASDAEVWNAFRQGDEDALVLIYKKYTHKMYNYGCQFTLNHELVSDAIQELFTEMISKRHRLGDTSSIKFYLFKALRRKLLRRLKKEQKHVSHQELTTQEGFNISGSSEMRFIHQEFSDQQKQIIAQECNQLPIRQKEALMLYFYESMSYREVAKTLGMSRTKSARALIYRAIDSLSVRLQRYKNLLYPLWPLLLSTTFF
uniref:Sigma-70 family RNA polymerase sigma factor n=1 Tax=Roseihalotalea indica TaxID=2867963 RepID=A0AA49GL70_9BACT|nr:sigma-70 family RNA polymerase sigma factor [Tunicatimonas sp. TK19036]